jgi:hypothetical protein
MSNEILGSRFNLNDAIIRQSERINSNSGNKPTTVGSTPGGRSFEEILNEKLNQRLSFSKHASQRSEERNIRISESDLTRLEDACDRAQQKGIKEP